MRHWCVYGSRRGKEGLTGGPTTLVSRTFKRINGLDRPEEAIRALEIMRPAEAYSYSCRRDSSDSKAAIISSSDETNPDRRRDLRWSEEVREISEREVVRVHAVLDGDIRTDTTAVDRNRSTKELTFERRGVSGAEGRTSGGQDWTTNNKGNMWSQNEYGRR